ncbi:MAG TPA: hypothetical protein VF943_06430 [Burkholderiales bacterium]
MWGRAFASGRWLLTALLSAALLFTGAGTSYAQSSSWRWIVVEPGPGGISHFSGEGEIQIRNENIQAELKLDEPGLDPFRFRGTIDKKGQVSGLIIWPHSDAGDVKVTGRYLRRRLPDGSSYENLWLLDAATGIYLVATVERKGSPKKK